MLGLIGSAVVLIQLGYLATLWLPYGPNWTEQMLLDLLLFAFLLAFSGSFTSYFRPRIGGSALLLAGTAPVLLQLFIIYATSSKYGGGPGPLLWTPVLALEITGPVFLTAAGAFALTRENTGPASCQPVVA